MTSDEEMLAGSDQWHEVRLLRVPVALHAQAQEHNAELMREMYLLAQQVHDHRTDLLPTRLVALVGALGTQFAEVTTVQDQQLDDAVARGVEELDVVYRVPVEAAEASRAVDAMLDEADEFCREGQHLLTLATPEELLHYRRWYLAEFINQIAGRPATPWPDYRSTV
jgi:hypothetical protein